MALHYQDSLVEVTRMVVGPIANNVFVIRCRRTGEAVLLDAANEHGRLLDACKTLNVRSVLQTHGHWDHIGAVTQLREAGYHVGVAAADASMLPSYDEVIDDGDVIEVGHLRVRAVATPGHTPGSTCFHVEDTSLLFVGDTLFPGGPGATHLPGGHFPTIMQSISERLYAPFPADTIVLPGHGVDTTIGDERPHFDQWLQLYG